MENKFSKGLVLGKFLPPHNGHLHLINTAAEQCDKVYVFICSLKSEPINGKLRANWLRMIYDGQKNIEIIHVEDENPQKPEECASVDTFYNDFWVPTVQTRVSELDVIFTSEAYGDEFAGYLGVKHVLVDIERVTYPVSGTKVRNTPIDYWDFIPNIVKEYYTKRIVIMGPESTGKSTLVERLAEHYGTSYVTEYGREYVERMLPEHKWSKEDFKLIALQHDDNMLEKQLSNHRPWLFVDTEAITTKVFSEMYLNGEYDNRLDDIIRHQWFDLILLMDVDVPWINDGTRDFPNERKKHFNRLQEELTKWGKPFIVINGDDYDVRFEKAKEEVDKLGYL